jgi:putative membrane protein
MNDDQPTSGEDVSGHPTTDSPYLRAKSKPAASAGQQQAAAKLSQKDQKFLSQIAAGGAQAVADSKVAQQQGGASVKNAASRVVSERSKSNAELQALAKKKGLSLGTDKIKARSMGKNFDKQYVHTLSRDLQEDVKLLQGAANSSDDKDIKAWAGKTLPSVKGELNAVQSAGK